MADTLAKQVQDTPGAATEVDDKFAWPDPYFVELGVGVGRQIGNLAFEPRLLSFGASKQIIVRLRHSTLPLLAGHGMWTDVCENEAASPNRQS
jgi:hypothetical protein